MPNPYAGLGLIPADNPIPGMIDAAAERYGVDRNLAHVVAQMESNYNPRAVSGAGAQGVMQLMPATARGLGVTDSLDAAQNIDGGVKYLAQLSDRYNGDPRLVLAAYNAGPGAVDRYGGVPPYQETQNYVALGTKKLGSANREAPATQPYADLGLIPVDQTAPQAGPQASVEILPPLSEPPSAKPPAPEKTFKGFLDNATTGLGRILEPLTDPAGTLENVTNLLQGMSEKSGFAPVMGQSHQQVVDGIVNLYKQRYGSLEGFKNAWYDDPVGMAGDVAMVFSGAGLGAKAAQDFLEASGITQHAAAIADILPEAEAGAAGTRMQAGVRGAVEALGRRYREVVQAGIEKAPSGVLGGPHGMLSTAKYGAAKKAGEILKEGWQAGTAAYDAPAGEAAAAGATAPGTSPPPAAPSVARTPGQVYAESQGVDWSSLRPQDQTMYEHLAQAHENVAQQPAQVTYTPPAAGTPPMTLEDLRNLQQPPAPPMTTTELAQDLSGGRPPSKLSETEKAEAQAVLSQAPPAPAPVAPEAPPVNAARVSALTDFVRQNIPPRHLADFNPHEWGMVGEAAGVESPTPQEIAQVRSNVASAAAPIPPEVSQLPPAQAEAAVAPARAARTVEIPEGQTVAEALADEMRRSGTLPEAPAPPQTLGELMSPKWTPEPVPGKTPGAVIKAQNVEMKAQRYAAALSKYGLNAETVAGLEPGWVSNEAIASGEKPGWANVMHDLIADGLLQTKERNPPQSSLPRILELMRQSEGSPEAIAVKGEMTKAAAEQAFEELKQRAKGTPAEEAKPRARRRPKTGSE